MTDLVFAQPAGFWALLGLPVVLAIHSLQRESRRVVVTTAFLLERLAPASAAGRRFERLRQSLPLWLQLLAITLLALVLAQPRWLRADSTQSIAVVLDSSLSLEAFRPALRRALERRLPELASTAKRTNFTVTETDPDRPTLYAGSDPAAALAAVDRWQPQLGDHDPGPALTVARSLAGAGGIVVFATDRPVPLPTGVDLLAVGEPVANVGFVGAEADGEGWSALVINPSAQPQSREWWVETATGRSSPARIDLAPGEIRTLRGRFPAERLEVRLAPDAFSIDDRLPIVRPVPKKLRVVVPADVPFFARLAASARDVEVGGPRPDLTFHVDDPLAPAGLPAPGIVQVRDLAPAESLIPGPVVAADHPLTRDLAWSGLQVRDTFTVPSRPDDEVLVQAGKRPLIFLRGAGEARTLVFNFDVAQSNADRLPAPVVLAHRFLETERRRKIAPETANVELAQELLVVGESRRAPSRPGFFDVRRDDRVLFDGAAHFADPREADFRAAAAADTLAGRAPALRRENSRDEGLTPALLLALLALVLANATATAAPRPAATLTRA